MKFVVLLTISLLLSESVNSAKGKGKGKGKGGKGKPTIEEPTGSGLVSTGSGEEPVRICEAGEAPCPCEESRKGKGKGKGKGNGKGKGEGTTAVVECCCQEGEGNVPEPRGFCIDEMRMGKICIAGSALEEKMPGALKECSEQCEMLPESRSSALFAVTMRKGKGGKGGKGKGKGKGNSSCPKPSVIVAVVERKFKCENCVMEKMGWMINSITFDEERIKEDVATLPDEISESLSNTDYEECISNIASHAMGYKKCMKDYSKAEKQMLQELFEGVASVECHNIMFERGCAMYMDNTISVMSGMEGNEMI